MALLNKHAFFAEHFLKAALLAVQPVVELVLPLAWLKATELVKPSCC
jgi:hypothetical protein